jgi:hypothetical protein
VLSSDPLVYEGHTLSALEGDNESGKAGSSRATGVQSKPQAVFAPRTAGRPKAGLGKSRAPPVLPATATSTTKKGAASSETTSQTPSSKGQDDFRKLLG